MWKPEDIESNYWDGTFVVAKNGYFWEKSGFTWQENVNWSTASKRCAKRHFVCQVFFPNFSDFGDNWGKKGKSILKKTKADLSKYYISNHIVQIKKYTLYFEQIHLTFWTNAFFFLNKYILLFRKNTFLTLDKYILQSGQIHQTE